MIRHNLNSTKRHYLASIFYDAKPTQEPSKEIFLTIAIPHPSYGEVDSAWRKNIHIYLANSIQCTRNTSTVGYQLIQLSSQSRKSGVKYDTTMVAPALRIPSVLSNAIVLRSKTPALAAACIMANSPLTW